MAARGGSEELQVKEQQLEAWEEKLAQRAAALADSAKGLAGRRAALTTQLQQARQAGVANPNVPRELLSADPLASSPATQQAREAAQAARKAAADARQRAAQLWEEELAKQQAALSQLNQRLGEAQAALQQQLAEAEAQAAVAAEAAEVVEEASPFAPTPIPLGAPPAPGRPPSPPPPSRAAPVRPNSAPGRAPPPAPAPEPMLGHNQRVFARAKLKVQVDFESDHNFFTGFSSDISEGGLFIATVNIRPLGSPVEVAFALPTGEQVMARGLVKWVREATPDNQAQPGMGIQFEALSDDAREAVHRFIEQREPIFYDE